MTEVLKVSDPPCTLDYFRLLTEGKRRAGMGKPFAVGVSACVVGGVAGLLRLPASSGS